MELTTQYIDYILRVMPYILLEYAYQDLIISDFHGDNKYKLLCATDTLSWYLIIECIVVGVIVGCGYLTEIIILSIRYSIKNDVDTGACVWMLCLL